MADIADERTPAGAPPPRIAINDAAPLTHIDHSDNGGGGVSGTRRSKRNDYVILRESGTSAVEGADDLDGLYDDYDDDDDDVARPLPDSSDPGHLVEKPTSEFYENMEHEQLVQEAQVLQLSWDIDLVDLASKG